MNTRSGVHIPKNAKIAFSAAGLAIIAFPQRDTKIYPPHSAPTPTDHLYLPSSDLTVGLKPGKDLLVRWPIGGPATGLPARLDLPAEP